jgi:NAD(P)H-hydrate repair Nnr-like enzyme with NAD(P)H-hydrate epimerase domain
LWTQGADVEVCLIGKAEEAVGDARTNFDILRKISDKEGFELTQADLVFEEIDTLEEWLEYDSLNFHSEDPDVIVDALFGTGLTRPLEEIHEQVAAFIFAYNLDNVDQSTLIVSLDVPSGLDADKADKCCVTPCAHLTVTFTAPKIANVLAPASNYNGELVVANIGSPCELIDNSPSQTFFSEKKDAQDWLKNQIYVGFLQKQTRSRARRRRREELRGRGDFVGECGDCFRRRVGDGRRAGIGSQRDCLAYAARSDDQKRGGNRSTARLRAKRRTRFWNLSKEKSTPSPSAAECLRRKKARGNLRANSSKKKNAGRHRRRRFEFARAVRFAAARTNFL